jgi:hypothetical protein
MAGVACEFANSQATPAIEFQQNVEYEMILIDYDFFSLITHDVLALFSAIFLSSGCENLWKNVAKTSVGGTEYNSSIGYMSLYLTIYSFSYLLLHNIS